MIIERHNMIGIGGKLKDIFGGKGSEEKDRMKDTFDYDPNESIDLLKSERKKERDAWEEKSFDLILEKTGWDKETALRKLDDAKSETGASYGQFLAYGFSDLSVRKRNDYFTERDAEEYCELLNDDRETLLDLSDRVRFLTKYKKYTKRVFITTAGLTASGLKAAFKDREKVVYKPLYLSVDKKVRVFNIETAKDLQNAFSEIKTLGEGIIEEYIEQDPRLAAFSGTLNTVRVGTVNTDNEKVRAEKNVVHIPYAVLSLGRSGEETDGIYSDGIVSAINLTKGATKTAGVDRKGQVYDTHPDSELPIDGFEVPFFEEIKEMVQKAAEGTKGFLEWNVAITSEGPVLVSADPFPSAEMLQLPYVSQGKGVKKNMEKFYDLSLKPQAAYGTKISKISSKGIEFYWKKLERADGYIVYRSYDPEEPLKEIARIEKRTIGTYTDQEFDRDRKNVLYSVASYIINDEGEMVLSPKTEAKAAVKRENLELNLENLYMFSDSKRRLYAYYEWETVEDAEWSSSNPEVATVDKNGRVTSLKKGVCDIICKADSIGMTAVCHVEVDRDAPEPLSEITSRYTYNENTGFYEQVGGPTGKKASLLMVGDLMCGRLQTMTQVDPEVGWNYNDSFEYVRRVTKDSDLAVGNLETLLASSWPYMIDEAYIENTNNCNNPPRYLDAVKYGGFDAVVMSNNHNCDGGPRALLETIDQVDRYQFIHTGVFRNEDEKRFFIADVNGIRIGFLSYNSVKTGYNGKDASWSKSERDVLLNNFSYERAAKDVEDLRKAGAEFVISYMHWGAKNYKTMTDIQIEEAQQMADAGADYIVGSNPHVLQPYDVLTSKSGKKVPCAYSVGNFQSIMNQIEGNRDSVMLQLTLKKDMMGNVVIEENNYIPFYTYTLMEGNHWAPVPLSLVYDFKLKRIKRKEHLARIVHAMGNKITYKKK